MVLGHFGVSVGCFKVPCFGDCFRKFPLKFASPKIPKISPEKNSGTFPNVFGDYFRFFFLGTFPSVFGDCSRKFPPKFVSPKKIRERSRMFLGMFLRIVSEKFPQNPFPREKNSGTFPSVFRDCFRKIPPNLIGGLLLKISPHNLLHRKKFGNVSRSHTIC